MPRRKIPRRPAARNSRKAALWRAFAVLMVILVAVALVDWRLRPIVRNMAAYQAQVAAMRTINNALMAELEREEIHYANLVTVTHNADGQVTSIQTDMMEVNRLKSRMVDSILAELGQEENREIFVPLGTLLGNQFTSGLGPDVRIEVIPTGYVQAGVRGEFQSAGINQTLHRMLLQINLQVLVILPGYSIQADAGTDFCLAETVIVGQIPEGFTEINGDDGSTIAKINDYSAHRQP